MNSDAKRPPKLIRRSHGMRRMVGLSRSAALRKPRAALRGETGSGKSLVAKWLHRECWGHGASTRAPLVIDCAAEPERAEQYLVHGKRTNSRRPPTVIMEAIDTLPREQLVRVAYLWRDHDRQEPDGTALVLTMTDDPAAFAGDPDAYGLRELVALQPAIVPPLRDRRMDMPGLVRTLLRELGAKRSVKIRSVASEALDALVAYHWPENVHELREVLEHALLANCDRDRLELADLPRRIRLPALADGAPDGGTLAEVERRHILATLQRFGGNRGNTAEALGIHVNTLCRRLKVYGVGRTRKRRASPRP